MNYVLLVYVAPESLRGLSSEDKLALHGGGHAAASGSASLVAHYRLRPPRTASTLRLEKDEIVATEGPLVDMTQHLRALYVLDSEDLGAVFDFASQLPAVRFGGIAEVWPLLEQSSNGERHDAAMEGA